MTALKPVSQVARIVVEGKWGNQNTVNVYHWQKVTPVSPFTQAEIDSVASSFRGGYVANFIPLQVPAFVLGACVAVDLSSDTGVMGVVTTTTAGAAAGTSNPANVALVVSWEINRRYRGGHPRSYMPGTATANVSGTNSWVAGTLTAWSTAGDAFLASMNAMTPGAGTTGRMVAVHRYRDKVELTSPLVSGITGSHVDTRIDSQRRRLGKAPG
jgi:hypothetical protein